MRKQKPTSQPHGTPTRYVAGCSCLYCCEAWAEYAKEARVGRKYIRRNVPAHTVRQRVLMLLEHMTLLEVSRRAGVQRQTIRAIRDGKYTTVKRATKDAIFGVAFTASDEGKRSLSSQHREDNGGNKKPPRATNTGGMEHDWIGVALMHDSTVSASETQCGDAA